MKDGEDEEKEMVPKEKVTTRSRRASSATAFTIVTRNLWYEPVFSLLKLLLAPKLVIVTVLCQVTTTFDYESITTALVELFSATGHYIRLMRWAVKMEVAVNSNASTVLRGTSISTKMVSQFCQKYCSQFLVELLAPIITSMYEANESYEVDPLKLGEGENLEHNQAKLIHLCEKLLSVLFNAAYSYPKPLREFLGVAQKEVVKTFPEMQIKIMGAMFFLRLVNPAVVSPQGFGVVADAPPPRVRRALVLVGKLLQNLANMVQFGDKEPFMVPFNDFHL